jgi:type I restriction enzyme, S subunit
MITRFIRVGAVAEQIRGVTYSKDEASAFPKSGFAPILRAGNITEYGLSFEDLVFVPVARISEKQQIRRNDVVIAASSGSLDVIGKAAPAKHDFNGAFGAFCKVLRPGPEVDPGFFAHFFKTAAYRRTVSELATGVNINNLRNEHLDDLLIPLPPMAEQRRIAEVLDQAETLRAMRRAAFDHSHEVLRGIFSGMFGDPTRNPYGWERIELGKLLTKGPQNGLYKPGAEYGSGTQILRIDAFYDGVVTQRENLKRVRVSDEELNLYGLNDDEIVLNRVNSLEYLGKSAIIPKLSESMVFESNMMRFDVDRERIDPIYAIQFLQTDYVKRQIRAAAKHSVNQSSINQQDVKSFLVNVPPRSLQREFARRVEAIERMKAAQRASLAELDALFASLQHRAFRGEL